MTMYEYLKHGVNSFSGMLTGQSGIMKFLGCGLQVCRMKFQRKAEIWWNSARENRGSLYWSSVVLHPVLLRRELPLVCVARSYPGGSLRQVFRYQLAQALRRPIEENQSVACFPYRWNYSWESLIGWNYLFAFFAHCVNTLVYTVQGSPPRWHSRRNT